MEFTPNSIVHAGREIKANRLSRIGRCGECGVCDVRGICRSDVAAESVAS